MWEAQRGGPRRKLKAVKAVPFKANPVDLAIRPAPTLPHQISWQDLIGTRRQGRLGRGTAVRKAGGHDSHPPLTPNDVGPLRMMPAGYFQQEFWPAGSPLGMDPAFIPMAHHSLAPTATGLPQAMTWPVQAHGSPYNPNNGSFSYPHYGSFSYPHYGGTNNPHMGDTTTNESNDKNDAADGGKISDTCGKAV